MVEEILRHVVEDDVTRRPDPLERPERDEPVAGADVEYDVSRGYLGVVEDAITHGGEVFELSPQQLGVAAVPTAQEPLRPVVLDFRRHAEAGCSSGPSVDAAHRRSLRVAVRATRSGGRRRRGAAPAGGRDR